MLDTELQEAAVALGRALQHAPAVSEYREAVARLAADPVAKAVLDALQDQIAVVTRLQAAGRSSSDEHNELRDRQAAVRANDTVMRNLRATNEVKAYLPEVARQVSASLGADYASLIAPTSC